MAAQVLPAVSTKPLTLPDDVELRTAKRARLHCHSDEASGAEQIRESCSAPWVGEVAVGSRVPK